MARMWPLPRIDDNQTVTVTDPLRIRLAAIMAGLPVLLDDAPTAPSPERAADVVMIVVARNAHCRPAEIADETGLELGQIHEILMSLQQQGRLIYDGRAELTDDEMRAYMDRYLESIGVDPARLEKPTESRFDWRIASRDVKPYQFDVRLRYTRRNYQRRYIVEGEAQTFAWLHDRADELNGIEPIIYHDLESAVFAAFHMVGHRVPGSGGAP